MRSQLLDDGIGWMIVVDKEITSHVVATCGMFRLFHQAAVAQLQVEHYVNCVVVGFIADMDLAEKKGIKGLDKVRLVALLMAGSRTPIAVGS